MEEAWKGECGLGMARGQIKGQGKTQPDQHLLRPQAERRLSPRERADLKPSHLARHFCLSWWCREVLVWGVVSRGCPRTSVTSRTPHCAHVPMRARPRCKLRKPRLRGPN